LEKWVPYKIVSEYLVTKIVQNLEKKKFREKYNLFKIEGEKLVGELLHYGLCLYIGFSVVLILNKEQFRSCAKVVTFFEIWRSGFHIRLEGRGSRFFIPGIERDTRSG